MLNVKLTGKDSRMTSQGDSAEDATGPQSPSPKFATNIPPAITAPDQVESRLGTLRFIDGFPDDATVETVYDNLDFQQAVQAFLTAMPAASLLAMREGLRNIGVTNQAVAIYEDLMDARSLFL